ncbi:hypothetical protein VARIO8X_60565 [Burkholderiales bacterium 8X]|nr:hypothetical protein VARIO8X_60565 [Burkholderiales bacterium 8X]
MFILSCAPDGALECREKIRFSQFNPYSVFDDAFCRQLVLNFLMRTPDATYGSAEIKILESICKTRCTLLDVDLALAVACRNLNDPAHMGLVHEFQLRNKSFYDAQPDKWTLTRNDLVLLSPAYLKPSLPFFLGMDLEDEQDRELSEAARRFDYRFRNLVRVMGVDARGSERRTFLWLLEERSAGSGVLQAVLLHAEAMMDAHHFIMPRLYLGWLFEASGVDPARVGHMPARLWAAEIEKQHAAIFADAFRQTVQRVRAGAGQDRQRDALCTAWLAPAVSLDTCMIARLRDAIAEELQHADLDPDLAAWCTEQWLIAAEPAGGGWLDLDACAQAVRQQLRMRVIRLAACMQGTGSPTAGIESLSASSLQAEITSREAVKLSEVGRARYLHDHADELAGLARLAERFELPICDPCAILDGLVRPVAVTAAEEPFEAWQPSVRPTEAVQGSAAIRAAIAERSFQRPRSSLAEQMDASMDGVDWTYGSRVCKRIRLREGDPLTHWVAVHRAFHDRHADRFAMILIDRRPRWLMDDEALAWHVSPVDGGAGGFKLQARLWRRRGPPRGQAARPLAAGPMDRSLWYDTCIPCGGVEFAPALPAGDRPANMLW